MNTKKQNASAVP